MLSFVVGLQEHQLLFGVQIVLLKLQVLRVDEANQKLPLLHPIAHQQINVVDVALGEDANGGLILGGYFQVTVRRYPVGKGVGLQGT